MSEMIPHDGKGRPHPPGTYVEARLRSGKLIRTESVFICWPWHERDDGRLSNSDVIEWRALPQPPTKDEIIATLVEALSAVAAVGDATADRLSGKINPGEWARDAATKMGIGLTEVLPQVRAALAKAKGDEVPA